MVAPWVKEELASADLRDKRLNEFFWDFVDLVVGAAAGEHTGGVRWQRGDDGGISVLRQREGDVAAVARAHREATLQRIAGARVRGAAQDTTEVDLTYPTC